MWHFTTQSIVWYAGPIKIGVPEQPNLLVRIQPSRSVACATWRDDANSVILISARNYQIIYSCIEIEQEKLSSETLCTVAIQGARIETLALLTMLTTRSRHIPQATGCGMDSTGSMEDSI